MTRKPIHAGSVALLRFPEYDRSWEGFVDQAVDELMRANDPLLRQMRRSTTQYAGPVQYADLGEPIIHQPLNIQAPIQLATSAILDTEVEAIIASIADLAEKCLEQLMKQFFRRFGELCEEAGTAVSADGRAIDWDLVLDAFDRMDFGFDEAGNPELPTLCAHPKMKEALDRQTFTEAHRNRLGAIIAKKREEFRARQRRRRLS
jgi:hypothetical protein